MVPQGRPVLMGWRHQGFSPGGNEGCDRSLGVQVPQLDGWSLRPLLATVSEYIGTSLSKELAQNGVRRELFLGPLEVRAAPFALLRNSRKTDSLPAAGLRLFLSCLVPLAAPLRY
jgi:hypothetical protein